MVSITLWTGVQGCVGTAGVRGWRRMAVRMSRGKRENSSLYRHVRAWGKCEGIGRKSRLNVKVPLSLSAMDLEGQRVGNARKHAQSLKQASAFKPSW